MKAFMLIGVIILLQACSQTEQDVLNLNLQEYKSLALHIHPELEIEVFGEKQIIPGNIGISPEGMKAIHTHEPDRILHVESPYPHQFVIGDFFKIWGERFDSKCIFNLCEDEGHELLDR